MMKKPASVKIKKEEGISEKAKTRYSDEELEEFRQIILSKLEKAHNDLRLLTESYTTGNDHDTNDTSPTFKVLEEGYQVFSKEENSKFAARQSKFIKALENALIRIENKSYGICRITGKLIPKDRLRIVPHATLSIEAKRNQTVVTVPPTQPSQSSN
jgi:RNA polymerase-binding transcription factor DksA